MSWLGSMYLAKFVLQAADMHILLFGKKSFKKKWYIKETTPSNTFGGITVSQQETWRCQI